MATGTVINTLQSEGSAMRAPGVLSDMPNVAPMLYRETNSGEFDRASH